MGLEGLLSAGLNIDVKVCFRHQGFNDGEGDENKRETKIER